MAQAINKTASINFGAYSFAEVNFDSIRGLVDERYAHELHLSELWTSLRAGEEVRGLREGDNSAGRGEVYYLRLNSGVSVVIRFYRRGGFLRRLLRELFFRNPFTSAYNLRPLLELQALAVLSQAKVSVPEPVAALVSFRGMGLSYQGMLITREIENAENLLSRARAVAMDNSLELEFKVNCKAAGIEARRMLAAGVFHPDLHLGNVLIPKLGERVVLIDFDKAERFPLGTNLSSYEERLRERWRRSAEKHGVSSLAIEPFSAGLKAAPLER